MVPKDNNDDKDKPVKINKWDGSAVKNALDDAIKEVFTTKYNYVENFNLLDCRLAICGIAVGVAMFAILWDYLYPFPLSRNVLIFCVSTYFVMMSLLTVYTTYKEKGIFAVIINKGAGKKEKVWQLSSCLKKYDDKYNLLVSVQDKATGEIRDTTVTRCVANFFDTEGMVAHDNVENEITKIHNSLLSDKKDK